MVTPSVSRTSRKAGPPVKGPSLLRSLRLPFALLLLALILLLASPRPAAAQANGGSILIWPVGPVIEADERAAALWLENPGTAPITLQIRIYAWAQVDGKNVYAAQDAVLGTPPIVTIVPGEKQLVRLTRLLPTPPRTEAAYRVIVDEIPAAKPAGGAGAAVSFRMRYSVPLFAYGEGLASPEARTAARTPDVSARSAPALDWRIDETADGRFLEIRNRGAVHARLTDVAFTAPGSTRADDRGPAKGLYGYILAGETMRWPLDAAPAVIGVAAAVNGAASTPIERRTD